MPLALFAQLSDGPYVLYHNNDINIHQVVDGKPKLTTRPLSAKQGLKVKVTFSQHADWNFEVPLKDTIVTEANVYDQPAKMFVLSDIEGEFEGFRALLLAGKVINKKYEWTYGKGHLIICGDLFDRGPNVPEGMWLLYKLEDEAKKSGGYVHVVLGNHDVMNMAGDWRYVAPKYKETANLMQLDYAVLYDTQAELGRWLRSKNVMEKIGNGLYMHGGISPKLPNTGLSLAQINQACRKYLGVKKIDMPEDIKPFFASATAPFWYRGYFNEPKITQEEMMNTLAYFNVSQFVVGHTITKQNIAFYYSRKVLGVDVNQHRGDSQAAVFRHGKWTKINGEGKKSVIPVVN